MAATETVLHRWFEEVWNQGQEEAIDELLAPDAVVHGLGPEEIRGPSAFKPLYRNFRTAFPDMRFTLERAMVDGDMVAVCCEVTATHSGDGFLDAPTHKPVRLHGMCMARVKDGKIAEGWNNFDFLTLYQQLGMKLT